MRIYCTNESTDSITEGFDEKLDTTNKNHPFNMGWAMDMGFKKNFLI